MGSATALRIRSRAIALPLSGAPSSTRRHVEAARPEREVPAPAWVVAVISSRVAGRDEVDRGEAATAAGVQRARELI